VKRTFTRVIVIAFMIVAVMSSAIVASGTPAGTEIKNNATVTYKDVNSNAKPTVTSNTVTTVVNTVRGVDISPVDYTCTTEEKTNDFAFTVTNTGNANDSIGLGLTGIPAGWSYFIYHDVDGDGTLDPEDSVTTANTGTLTADQAYHVIIRIVAPAPPEIINEVIAGVFTATSVAAPSVSDSSTINLELRQAVIAVTKSSSNEEPMPLEPFDYTISVANSGKVAAYNVVITDSIPDDVDFIGPVFYDEDGSGPATTVQLPGAYSAGVITVVINPLAAETTATITFSCQVKDKVAVSTSIGNTADVAYKDADGNTFADTDICAVTVANKAGVDIAESYNGFADPGDELKVYFTVENKGNGPDDFILSAIHSGTFDIVWTIYLDVNKDGTYETMVGSTSKTDTSIGTTGSIEVDQINNYVAIANVPVDAIDTFVNTISIYATSTQPPIPFASDVIIITHTIKAPILTLTKSVDKATADPGETLTYTIVVTNTGTGDAIEVIISDNLSSMISSIDYVVDSTTVDDVAQTDAEDGDYTKHDANVLTVKIPKIDGTLASGTPKVTYTIIFKVTIK